MAQLVEPPVIDREEYLARILDENQSVPQGHLEEMAEFEIQASVKLAHACLGFRVMEERALAKRITPARYRQGVAERFPKYKQSVPLYTFIGRQLDFDAEFLMDIKGGVDLRGSTDVVWTDRDADQPARPGQGDRTHAQPGGHRQSGWPIVTLTPPRSFLNPSN